MAWHRRSGRRVRPLNYGALRKRQQSTKPIFLSRGADFDACLCTLSSLPLWHCFLFPFCISSRLHVSFFCPEILLDCCQYGNVRQYEALASPQHSECFHHSLNLDTWWSICGSIMLPKAGIGQAQ